MYSGLIRIRHEAQRANAFQTNRNLVLSEGAEARSVPNLEIEANDVHCSHASAYLRGLCDLHFSWTKSRTCAIESLASTRIKAQ